MKIRYTGPAARIDYPISVERGETVEVDAKLGRELVKQSSWEKITETKKKEKES